MEGKRKRGASVHCMRQFSIRAAMFGNALIKTDYLLCWIFSISEQPSLLVERVSFGVGPAEEVHYAGTMDRLKPQHSED